ncbi:hypothetical protein MAPG_07555 [Magnaporthiopsis poae ATCC 64411]|uniref:Uncharacterized protein n=1 Tax=Magnaporthiopsis poae (strain ATCC 64411 / 73-15) TaxID=644358 RepID=A0A0C4E4Z8_MAGP6|nr:hypothetical protein MAPG_07555 [Magnaporthiopsis poae ATCC 64411]
MDSGPGLETTQRKRSESMSAANLEISPGCAFFSLVLSPRTPPPRTMPVQVQVVFSRLLPGFCPTYIQAVRAPGWPSILPAI